MKVTCLNNTISVYSNHVYVAPGTFDVPSCYVMINDRNIYISKEDVDIKEDEISMSKTQRFSVSASIGDEIIVKKANKLDISNTDIDFTVSLASKNSYELELEYNDIVNIINNTFKDHIISIPQRLCIDFRGTMILLDSIGTKGSAIINDKSIIRLSSTHENVVITGNHNEENTLLMSGSFNFEKHGIGGLDNEAEEVFRRAFLSRMFPPGKIRDLNIKHVKGILLYGPPGTGKTLMARQIGKMLDCVEPIIVNGPEIFNKYVGGSEENVRKLFANAEKEEKSKGSKSKLHLIILDEFDSIARQRGSGNDNTGAKDNVINQLLSKIDGVESLNNVLLIGMTNRIDMIDKAILRPGRFEIQIETKLPNLHGRKQIFDIHTKNLTEREVLSKDVDINLLASETENYTGAEIEGVIRSAISHAMKRAVDEEDLSKLTSTDIKITKNDMALGLKDIKPALGRNINVKSNIIDYGERWKKHEKAFAKYMLSMNNNITKKKTILMTGKRKSGKFNAALYMAENSNFPFIKIISGDNMIGMDVYQTINYIKEIFDNAHKSSMSIVIIKDILDLINFNISGPRFVDTILQTLIRCINKIPSNNNKILIIGTTRNPEYLTKLNILDNWDIIHEIPKLNEISQKNVLQKLNARLEYKEDVSIGKFLDMISMSI